MVKYFKPLPLETVGGAFIWELVFMIDGLPKRPRDATFKNRSFTSAEIKFLGAQETLVGLIFEDCPLTDAQVGELTGLQRLVNVTIANAKISDAALKHVAQWKKLRILSLDRNVLTGSGFKHFADHPTLDCLWVNETRVSDSNLPLLLNVPRLSTLLVKGSSVTATGVLQLAEHPRLRVIGDFSPVENAAFEAAQRACGAKKSSRESVSLEEVGPALEKLKAFFQDMSAWEDEFNRREEEGPDLHKETKRKCESIFAQHCTSKPRKFGRPNALSYSSPSEFERTEITGAEQAGAGKVFIYTKNTLPEVKRRYLMIHKKNEWRLDHREIFRGGWKPEGL